MSKRTKFLLGIGVIATLLVGWQVAAFAVHDAGVFELEGNALDDTPGALPDDWENVFENTDSATVTSFETETPADASSIFTGGGSKDPIDITSWKWKDGGGLPDKDNLLHSFAARYTGTTGTYAGDQLLYFGSDRFDNSGDAVQGFWFLQDEVANDGPGGTFTGAHENGDLLVLSDFSNGGDVATIAVYEWNDRCDKTGQSVDRDGDPDTTGDTFVCGDANLLTLASDDTSKCGTEANDDFCGIVNPNTIELPWPFVDKSGTTLPDDPNDPDTDPEPAALNGEFFEGGVNLTELGLAERCFSTVVSETRSSTSTTAVLKDFVVGEFAVCAPGMTTQASTNGNVVSGQTSVTDTATITITGATNPDDPTGTVTFFLCGPLAAGVEGCATGGTNVGTGTLANAPGNTNDNDGTRQATSPAVNTVASPLSPGRYCFRAEWPGDTNYGPASHTNNNTECFTVSQPTTITTAQKWFPNDTATVTGATDGTVVFSLYENGTCSGTAARTFTDTAAPFQTNNYPGGVTTPYEVSTSTIISWSATFDPSGTAENSTTTRCERSDLTINNSASDFPPAGP